MTTRRQKEQNHWNNKKYYDLGQNIMSDFENHDSDGGYKLVRALLELEGSVSDPITGNFTELLRGLKGNNND